MIVPNNVIDLPPPSPPKPKTIVLPPNWKVARDPEGKIYYYHNLSRWALIDVCEVYFCASTHHVHIWHCLNLCIRQTQWDPPTWEGGGENTNVDHESEMDLGTPTYDENPNKVSFGQGILSEGVDKECVITFTNIYFEKGAFSPTFECFKFRFLPWFPEKLRLDANGWL